MRILSGVQSSGKLHLGNYFGAIKQFIELQHQGDAFYFIANLHALTTVRDGQKLRELTRDVALDFLALGLDPAKATLFRQSDVPEVTELFWILSSLTPLGRDVPRDRCRSDGPKVSPESDQSMVSTTAPLRR